MPFPHRWRGNKAIYDVHTRRILKCDWAFWENLIWMWMDTVHKAKPHRLRNRRKPVSWISRNSNVGGALTGSLLTFTHRNPDDSTKSICLDAIGWIAYDRWQQFGNYVRSTRYKVISQLFQPRIRLNLANNCFPEHKRKGPRTMSKSCRPTVQVPVRVIHNRTGSFNLRILFK